MNSILDIIVAFAMGGILLIIIFNANDIAGTQASVLNGDVLVQQMLVSITQILEGEFRNMGYGAHMDSAAIRFAHDTAITFLCALVRNGPIDTIRYYLGPLSDLAYTQNDSDRLLYRGVNSRPVNSIGAVTRFSLLYFTQGQIDTFIPPRPPNPLWVIRRPSGVDSASVVDTRQFKVIQVFLEVQNPYALYKRRDDPTVSTRGALFSSSMWRQTRLASQNLRR